ncbi:MAG TPA: tetratricopeptide repeat protein, partial [Planctomycetota bacterium]|nr:tetratricopeptide repeat protein [Planctomycetota bacterium]
MGGVPSGDAAGRPGVHDRAWHLYSTRRYELGAEECRATLAREPNCYEAHGLLALCLSRLSRHEEAEASARESLRSRPDHAWPHYVLGTVLRNRRRLRDAEIALCEAIRITPERVDYKSELACVFIDQDSNEKALEVAREARRLDPAHARPAALEGLALEALGRLDEAEAAFRDALRLNPENMIAHAGMGHLALRRLRGDEAAKAFQIALRNNPNYRWAESGLGDALRMQVPGYARMEAVESWLHRLTETQRSLLIAGGIAGFTVLLISTPFTISRETNEPTILTILLMGLFLAVPYGWAFAFWALRPLGELFLWLHPV